jgi:hypothetical protein
MFDAMGSLGVTDTGSEEALVRMTVDRREIGTKGSFGSFTVFSRID